MQFIILKAMKNSFNNKGCKAMYIEDSIISLFFLSGGHTFLRLWRQQYLYVGPGIRNMQGNYQASPTPTF